MAGANCTVVLTVQWYLLCTSAGISILVLWQQLCCYNASNCSAVSLLVQYSQSACSVHTGYMIFETLVLICIDKLRNCSKKPSSIENTRTNCKGTVYRMMMTDSETYCSYTLNLLYFIVYHSRLAAVLDDTLKQREYFNRFCMYTHIQYIMLL